LVGDAVNLCQRLQDLARPGGSTVFSEATWERLGTKPDDAEKSEPQLVKGRATPVIAYRIGPAGEEGADS
jgi:class 3 adenylate cyclase